MKILLALYIAEFSGIAIGFCVGWKGRGRRMARERERAA